MSKQRTPEGKASVWETRLMCKLEAVLTANRRVDEQRTLHDRCKIT